MHKTVRDLEIEIWAFTELITPPLLDGNTSATWQEQTEDTSRVQLPYRNRRIQLSNRNKRDTAHDHLSNGSGHCFLLMSMLQMRSFATATSYCGYIFTIAFLCRSLHDLASRGKRVYQSVLVRPRVSKGIPSTNACSQAVAVLRRLWYWFTCNINPP